MSTHEQALERIETTEKRLTALQELGVDSAALRSQLAFARTRVDEGELDGIDATLDDILAMARRLVDGGSSEQRPRTGRISRDRLLDDVRAVLSEGLLAKLLSEQQRASDPRLEARLAALEQAFDDRLSQAVLTLEQVQTQLRDDQNIIRQELQTCVAALAEVRSQAMPVASAPPVPAAPLVAPAFPILDVATQNWIGYLATQLNQQQIQAHDQLTNAFEKLAESVSVRAPAAIPSLGLSPSSSAQEDDEAEATAEETPTSDMPTATPAHTTKVGEVSAFKTATMVSDHDTTRRFNEESTRPNISAVPSAVQSLDADAVKRLIAAEVSSRLEEQFTAQAQFDAPNPPATVAHESDRRRAESGPRSDSNRFVARMVPFSDADLRGTLARLLPEVLKDDGVRTALFALIALESISNPGALGELTGLRSFLRKELKIAADDLSNSFLPA